MNIKNFKDLEQLTQLLKDNPTITKVEVTENGVSIEQASPYAVTTVQAHAPVTMAAAPALNPTPPATSKADESTDSAPPEESGHTVTSPMVGSVYLAPSPEDPPFAEEGQAVKVGDTLCLVEAMKMFNKIKADKSGKIKKCCVDNGQAVEYGQALFIIEG